MAQIISKFRARQETTGTCDGKFDEHMLVYAYSRVGKRFTGTRGTTTARHGIDRREYEHEELRVML